MTKVSPKQKRIDVLVSQLNDIARDQIAFMNFFPSLADDIVPGLAKYLGEDDCVRLSNHGDEFSFVEDYGHSGLGVEGGRFRIPVMVRIRDHASCQDVDDSAVEAEGQGTKKAERKKLGKLKKSGKKGKTKTKKQKVMAASFGETKTGKTKKSKKAKKKKPKKNQEDTRTDPDCNETFLRFKLFCELRDDDIIIDIAGTKKVTVRADDLGVLYEAIFDYLQDYFSPEKFFDKEVDSYQNASYGFFRKHF